MLGSICGVFTASYHELPRQQGAIPHFESKEYFAATRNVLIAPSVSLR